MCNLSSIINFFGLLIAISAIALSYLQIVELSDLREKEITNFKAGLNNVEKVLDGLRKEGEGLKFYEPSSDGLEKLEAQVVFKGEKTKLKETIIWEVAEVVHVAYTLCDDTEQTRESLFLSIKSLLFTALCDLHIHLFLNSTTAVPENIQQLLVIEKEMELERVLQLSVYDFKDAMQKQREAFKKTANEHEEGEKQFHLLALEAGEKSDQFVCESMGLYLHALLPATVEKIISVTPNALFCQDISLLWKTFDTQKTNIFFGASGQNFAMPGMYREAEHVVYRDGTANGLNSDVVLHNLKNQRNNRFREKISEAYRKHGSKVSKFQDFLNVLAGTNKLAIADVSCEWNYRPELCTQRNLLDCKNALKVGVAIMVLNSNAPDHPIFDFMRENYKNLKVGKGTEGSLNALRSALWDYPEDVKKRKCDRSLDLLNKALDFHAARKIKYVGPE